MVRLPFQRSETTMSSEKPLQVPTEGKRGEINGLIKEFTRLVVYNLREPARDEEHRVRLEVSVCVYQDGEPVALQTYSVPDPPYPPEESWGQLPF